MHRVLFSIHPEYAEKIFSGEKIFEYRKLMCRKEISTMLIYATSPVSKVIGEANISDILFGTPEEIWYITRFAGCISENEYFNYFKGRSVAYAFKLENPCKYDVILNLPQLGIHKPPQSFCYID